MKSPTFKSLAALTIALSVCITGYANTLAAAPTAIQQENSSTVTAVTAASFTGHTIEYDLPVIENPLCQKANAYFSSNLAQRLYASLPYASDEYGNIKPVYLKDSYSAEEILNAAKIADFIHTRNNKKALANNEYSNRYGLAADYEVKLNNTKYLSVLQSIYTYTGGAHGNTVRYSMTLDQNTGKVLSLPDLFKDDTYLEVLNNSAAQQNRELVYQEVKITGSENFYLTDSELVIYYQQYEIAPYAAGFVEYRFPYEQLQALMK